MLVTRALIADVIAAPDDDAPRRVLADRLLASDDPEANGAGELIQAQCELARGDPYDASDRALALRARIAALLAQHAPSLRRLPGGDVATGNFRRGFLTELVAPQGSMGALPPWLGTLLATGLIRHLEVGVHATDLPELAHVPSLYLRGHLWPTERLRQPRFDRLEELILDEASGLLLIELGARELAPILALPSLTALALPYLERSAEERFGAAPLAARLRALELASPNEEQLCLAGSFPALEQLNLHRTISRADLDRLADSARFPRLRALSVVSDELSAIVALARARDLAELSIDVDEIEDDEHQHLAHLPPLTALELRGGIDLSVRALESADLSALRRLDLSRGRITDAGAARLARLPLDGLRDLDLHDNDLGEAGATALAASPSLARLHHLDLRHNGPMPAGRALLRARFGHRVRLGDGDSDLPRERWPLARLSAL